MRMKLVVRLVLTAGFVSVPAMLFAQKQPGVTWTDIVPWVIAAAALVFGVYQHVIRKKDTARKKIVELEAEEEFKKKRQVGESRTAEDMYRAALKQELGTIHMLGSPDIDSQTVKLEDAFVSLNISESWRSDARFDKNKTMPDHEIGRRLIPEDVMKRAWQKYRLLLVVGDPGSGKTTLMKYYAMLCMENKWRQLGFNEGVLPIFFPLRELDYENGEPVSLPKNLEKWTERHLLTISADRFYSWLQDRSTLVLLDGLDEIGDMKRRRQVCGWIARMSTGLKNARFVVTTRATGYRKLDGIELEVPHLRADVMDFSPQQQEDFLRKWFRAVCLGQLPPPDVPEQEWREKQRKCADNKSTTIIDFLQNKDNKAIRELASVPMLLQIMAILWKDKEYLPKTRLALYDAALNYLLEHRDSRRGIEPVLPADEARRVLAPTALWMQEELHRDEAPKEDTHVYMQPILDTLEGQPKALRFCENLRDRAGLIADYRDHYVFRHKSFREFLSGIQLAKTSSQQERMETLVKHFKEDWWEEALRFFMCQSDDKTFDLFMGLLFESEVSRSLDDNQQTLLQNLVKDAPQKKIDALAGCLRKGRLNDNQVRYVLDCLKTIGTPKAIETIEFAGKNTLSKENLSYAQDIVAEAAPREERIIIGSGGKDLSLEASFRSPFEDNVEYIKIPGGTYKYSVSEEMVTVPDLFFCKYLVTNKRYRRFISFLQGGERDLAKALPMELFAKILLQFAQSLKGYVDYLGNNSKDWHKKLRSGFDEEKGFKDDNQPVVAVTWYAARAYCFWLSCLEAVINGADVLLAENNQVSSLYRLPTETEWEWAAGGEPNGGIREYPWPRDKGNPTPKLANYGGNVNATTPVGRYPDGATPLGLMDMAGNAWEWMENYADKDEDVFALRGGSWGSSDGNLRCSARSGNYPLVRSSIIGFRVVRSQS